MSEYPKLFRLRGATKIDKLDSPSFLTPLGQINLSLVLDGNVVLPDAIFQVDQDSIVTIWSSPFEFEMFLSRNPPVRSHIPVVDGLFSAVWRLGQMAPSGSVVKCLWAEDADWTEGGPENGENLNAMTWTDGKTKVTIGLPENDNATTYQRNGFVISLDLLDKPAGHLVCAWNPDKSEDVSTWLAVDCSFSELVNELPD